MIRLNKLIPGAVCRYDEDGEPLYTRPERILKTLNRRGESTAIDILDDIDAWGRDRFLFSAALSSLVKSGRVEMRTDHGLRLYRIAQQQKPSKARCGCGPQGRCVVHAEINRVRARETARRKAEAEGRIYRPRIGKEPWMCHECREPAINGTSRCQMHTEMNRERARKQWLRKKGLAA